ncbi:MAG: diguanylate cyclase [Gaiellales bacterium]
MPAPLASEIVLPAFVGSDALRVLGWVGTLLVIGVIASMLLRSRHGVSGTSRMLVSMIYPMASAILFGALSFVAMGFAYRVAQGDGLLASIIGTGFTMVMALAAYVAGLFIVRQFLAPPWWRLNAWDPSDSLSRDGFSLMDAFRWIGGDVRDLILSLRLLDRIIVLGAIPLAGLNVMRIFGVERSLQVAFGALLLLYLALVVALFSANRIPRVLLTRLQDLRQVARRIAGGDMSARVGFLDTAEYEELGELVGDINTMARVLQSRESENQALTQQLNQALQYEQERASRDPLTQLHNHRYFQEALAAELYRCSRTGELTTVAVIDLDDFKAVNDTYGHQEGDAVLIRTAQAFTQTLRPYDLPARLGGEEFGVIFPSTSPEEAKMVMDRIMEVLATAGPDGNVLTFSGGIATYPVHSTDQSTLYQLADSSAYAAKLNGKKHTVVYDPGRITNVAEDDRVNTRERDAQIKAARTLVQTVDMIEGAGNEHSENVGRISSKIAAAMGYDDAFAQQMYLCGLLHDVGKLGLDQTVIQKAGQLTPEEFEQIKRHPDLSAQIVSNAGLGEIATWVRHHHEHYDGTGYPERLVGHDIPFGSRIVLVAEAFDVMTSDRPYRQAMSLTDATSELLRDAGIRFDPEIVGVLVNLVRTGEVRPGGGTAPGAAPGGGGWQAAA